MKIVELKKDMDRQFGEVKADMDARFNKLEKDLDQKIATEHKTTRRHMEMLVEQVKAENRLGLDKMMATDQRVASLNAPNAREHTTIVAVLQGHEVRIKALETPNEAPETPHSST
jgi:hypothetical protein